MTLSDIGFGRTKSNSIQSTELTDFNRHGSHVLWEFTMYIDLIDWFVPILSASATRVKSDQIHGRL